MSGRTWIDGLAALALFGLLCWSLAWCVDLLRKLRGRAPAFPRGVGRGRVIGRALWYSSVPAFLCFYGVNSLLDQSSLSSPAFLFVPVPIAGAATAAASFVLAYVAWCVNRRGSATGPPDSDSS